MNSEKGLAQSIKYQAEKFLDSSGLGSKDYLKIGGMEVDYPFSEVKNASWDECISDDAFKNFEALESLFTNEKMPSKWVSFIREVGNERKLKGSEGPVDLISGLFFLTEEFAPAQKAGLEKFEELESGEIDFSDTKRISSMINTVLEDPILKSEYKKIIANLIPDVSNYVLDSEKIKKVLDKAGIKTGLLLDLGCGIGRETGKWSEKINLFTLGLDRQYHNEWYDPYWKDKRKSRPNLEFVLGDFAEGIPLVNDCADAGIFQFVAQHITQKNFEKGLKEALRVLKVGGYLFVGPQQTKDYINWRFFQKELSDNGVDYHFVEKNYYDIVPEDKAKPWRHKRYKRSTGKTNDKIL